MTVNKQLLLTRRTLNLHHLPNETLHEASGRLPDLGIEWQNLLNDTSTV
jgi:hypothetical protein